MYSFHDENSIFKASSIPAMIRTANMNCCILQHVGGWLGTRMPLESDPRDRNAIRALASTRTAQREELIAELRQKDVQRTGTVLAASQGSCTASIRFPGQSIG